MRVPGGPGIERWEPVWPNGARCAVMLSFDVDGRTLWSAGDHVAPRGVLSRALSLGDYGPHAAMPRIVDLLERLDVPATFFVPGYIAENYPEAILPVVEARAGHELGLHGYRHESFYRRDEADQHSILERSQEVFTRRFGTVARGFRAPSGDWTAATPRVLAEFGIEYSSSHRGDDRPFFWTFEQSSPPLVELPGHWELDDFPQFAYNDWPPEPAGQDRPASTARSFENWKWEFDGYYAEGLCWVLMTHPQTIGTPNRLAHLERLLRGMQESHDVWLATGSEIARWVASQRSAPAEVPAHAR